MEYIEYIKHIYDYAHWPESSILRTSIDKVTDSVFGNFTLLLHEEYPPYEGGFRKVYMHPTKTQVRIEIVDIPFSNFESAKEYLIHYLARCEFIQRRTLPGHEAGDIVFTPYGVEPSAKMYICSRHFIRIANIGETHLDLSTLSHSEFP